MATFYFEKIKCVVVFLSPKGAAASLAVGHISLDWAVWGEVILGGFTALISGALFLMNLTDNIWVSYACFALFKTLYMQLTTVCT